VRFGLLDAFFLCERSGDIAIPLRVISHVTFVVNVDGYSGDLFL